MHQEKVSFSITRSFSNFFLDYISQGDSLKPFYGRFPSLKNFAAQIKDKTSFPSANRDVLVRSLQQQYQGYKLSDVLKENIASLTSTNTFTVTTGHQLNIFTGPLYFIYKIVTVINCCKQLKEAYPKHNFVPVYWMASEDHDFEEISYFHLHGKKYQWKTDQRGAVGRFNPNGLRNILDEVPGQGEVFREAYLKQDTLSKAVRQYVNDLFGSHGLVVLDPDDSSLKKLFAPVVADDLFKRKTNELVEKTNASLELKGYKPQVHPRAINLFYLDTGIRNRIEHNEDRFQVVDSDSSFSKTEIEQLLQSEPQKFSPNVLLRPLYQELILPNLAYVGGPAEVTYWLQLKTVFDYFTIPFPILLPRNFAMVVPAPIRKKIAKTGLLPKDFFDEKNTLFNLWIHKNSQHDLSLGTSLTDAQAIFAELTRKATNIDTTLGPLVSAESQRVKNGLERIEKKLLKAEKRLHSDKLRQIEAVKESLFPNGSLQERHDNLLDFYLQDTAFIDKLIAHFDPFDFQFNILSYE